MGSLRQTNITKAHFKETGMAISIRPIVEANLLARSANDSFANALAMTMFDSGHINQETRALEFLRKRKEPVQRNFVFDQFGVCQIAEPSGQRWVRQNAPRPDGFSVWMNENNCKLTRRVVADESAVLVSIYYYDGQANLQCEKVCPKTETRDILSVPKHWSAR